MAKEPTLFSYLHRQDPTLPSTIDLAREAERREIERSSRVVTPKAKAKMQTRAQANTLTWTQTQTWTETSDLLGLQARSGQGPRSVSQDVSHGHRDATLNLVPNNQANGVPHETNNTWQQPPATLHGRAVCTTWLLLDHLRAEIARFRCETLEAEAMNFQMNYQDMTGVPHSRGLYEYLEVLIEEGGIAGGLLEGKVTALITALENGTLQGKGEEMQRAGVYMKQD
ncbi:hypothetical protein EDB84DRAFT_1437997 [Lactarius hengduanensis]|nr:hypothetical protein EDB84DRAFT_1437997 [Lactarius hengduanensis]